jgi:hypothetical protein
MLRESIRRSFRQIRDMTTPVHTPGNTVTSMAAMAEMDLARDHHHHQTSITSASRHLPPAYTSVILEMRSHGSESLRPGILSDRLSQLVDCESTEASTSGSSACSSTTDCTGGGTSSSSSSDTTSSSSAPMTAAELTRLLRESFRRSARSSLRFIRKNMAKPSADTERSVTDDDDTTDTDQGGGRHLVNGAVRIHRDPSLSNVVVTLPNATGNHSESIA